MASSDRDFPWSWIFCSMSRSSFWRLARSSCLAAWTFWTRARLSLPTADSWTIFWTSITPIFTPAVAGVWAEAPPVRTPRARAPAARVTVRFMDGTPSLILVSARTPSPRKHGSYCEWLERRPDGELEVGLGFRLDDRSRRVLQVFRLQVDSVDEPQGRLKN